jgi:hypothetical protein
MKYAVQLKGSEPLLPAIAPCFQGQNARISKVDGEWFLESQQFESCSGPNDVFPKADGLLRVIHLVTALYCQLFSPFEVGYVQAYSETGAPTQRALRAIQRVQIYSGSGVQELQKRQGLRQQMEVWFYSQ